MCSVICSSNISWITRSTISLRKEGSSSKIPCASCVSTLRWSVVIVLLPFDRLTSNTNHLGGRWPYFLATHQITEVYGHNPIEREPDSSLVEIAAHSENLCHSLARFCPVAWLRQADSRQGVPASLRPLRLRHSILRLS